MGLGLVCGVFMTIDVQSLEGRENREWIMLDSVDLILARRTLSNSVHSSKGREWK